jgi:hypothetical protein
MPEEEKSSVSTVLEMSAPLPNPTAVLRTTTDVPDVDHRAELQAMLALLAAQLAEVAHADEDDSEPKDEEFPATAVTDLPPPAVDGLAAVESAARQEEEEDSDEDMEEVI